MTKRLTASETDELAASIRKMLDAIRGGETTSTATIYRLEGALVALDAVAGRSRENILENLLPTSLKLNDRLL